MIELKFDTEGMTSCPMNETATWNECNGCHYSGRIGMSSAEYTPLRDSTLICRYKDKFPEPEEEKSC